MDKIVIVNDKMQNNYAYHLTESIWENFHPEFHPELTPQEMLNLWVFWWKYMSDCRDEFPKDWFLWAKLSEKKDASLNLFGVNASLSLKIRKDKWWIYHEDPRWRFQWYCRYYMGRRIEQEDLRQIKRWKAMKRHIWAIKKNCIKGDWTCRKKQRQALLHWAYDSRKL